MIREISKKKTILITEDNDDHFLLTQEAFHEARLNFQLNRVKDGEELMKYLHHTQGKEAKAPQPSIIILDLNMPRKDGRETLKEIRNSSEFNKIPIVILTNSSHDMDSYITKKYGAQAYYKKPMYFDQLVEILKEIPKFIKEKNAI